MHSTPAQRSLPLPLILLLVVAAAWAADYLWLTRTRDGFSWMDPHQYYGFAQGVLAGTRAWNGFEVASTFPYLLLPALWLGGGTVPAALATQAGLTLGILAGICWLCRELSWRGVAVPTGLLWLGTPLALGLAHELYSETALTLLVLLALAAAWRAFTTGKWGDCAVAGLLWGLTLTLKTTAPVFFAGPLLVLVTLALREPGRRGALARLSCSYTIGLLGVVALEALVFRASWDYWRSFGNTTIPIMKLIGPGVTDPLAAKAYYLVALGQLGWPFGVVTSLLVLCAVLAGAGFARKRVSWPTLYMLAAIAVPLVVFTIQPVKEPRHILPCLAPMLILAVAGLKLLPRPAYYPAIALLTLAALGQYLYATRVDANLPYLLRGATGAQQAADQVTAKLLPQLIGAGAASPADFQRQNAALTNWARYNLDVEVYGLPANEALALQWAFRPGIVVDSSFNPELASSDLPSRAFEDLFVYSAFNLYNARCRVNAYYGIPGTGEYDVLIEPEHPTDLSSRISPDDPTGADLRIPRPGNPGGALLVYINEKRPGVPAIRTAYALEFLKAHPDLPEPERYTVLANLRRSYVLRQDWAGLQAAAEIHPELVLPSLKPGRNIYWFGFYPGLKAIEDQLWVSGPYRPRRSID